MTTFMPWPTSREYAVRCVVCGAEYTLPFDPGARSIDPHTGPAGEPLQGVDYTGTLHLWADDRFVVFCDSHTQEESVTAFRLAEWKLTELPVADALARQTADHG